MATDADRSFSDGCEIVILAGTDTNLQLAIECAVEVPRKILRHDGTYSDVVVVECLTIFGGLGLERTMRDAESCGCDTNENDPRKWIVDRTRELRVYVESGKLKSIESVYPTAKRCLCGKAYTTKSWWETTPAPSKIPLPAFDEAHSYGHCECGRLLLCVFCARCSSPVGIGSHNHACVFAWSMIGPLAQRPQPFGVAKDTTYFARDTHQGFILVVDPHTNARSWHQFA